MRSPAGIAFALIGALLTGAGALCLWQDLRTGALIKLGNEARNGARSPSVAELEQGATSLAAAAGDHPSGAEAGALTFLDYRLAETAQAAGDTAAAQHYAALAEAHARQTLHRAPTRADVALALAELRYLGGADRAAVERPLLLSLMTAPRELWIIERRIALDLRIASHAPAELTEGISADIRTLGEPGHDPVFYRELASAAHAGGLYSIALVRRELAAQPGRSLIVFNEDIEALGRHPPR